jgi:hypothetical protein
MATFSSTGFQTRASWGVAALASIRCDQLGWEGYSGRRTTRGRVAAIFCARRLLLRHVWISGVRVYGAR